METRIWTGILDADRLTRYYSRLADKMRHRGRVANAFLGVASTSAVASLLAHVSPWIVAIIVVVIAVIAVWAHLSGYARKAAISVIVAKQCQSLAIDWKGLWERQHDVPDLLSSVEALQERMDEATSWYDGEEDTKLNRKCQEEAYAAIPQEFGS